VVAPFIEKNARKEQELLRGQKRESSEIVKSISRGKT
jgi:hypothetical protein